MHNSDTAEGGSGTKCPVCGEQALKQWGVVGIYEILACRCCGLGITHPFPTPEELASSNAQIYQVQHRIETYLSRQNYFERRYRQYVANIKRFKQGGRLLDIGCNLGLFLKVAREQGFDVTGVELNRQCAEFGAERFGVEIHADYLEKLHFPDKTFDVVTLFDVLEHVPDIHGFLGEVRRILKSGGLLLIQSPNFSSLMARLTGTRWNWLTPPDHLYHFSPDSLQRLLHDAGFETGRVRTWEPAREFALNLLLAHKSKNIMLRVLFGIERVCRLATTVVFIIQRVWWRKMQGGLLEVYALRRDGA